MTGRRQSVTALWLLTCHDACHQIKHTASPSDVYTVTPLCRVNYRCFTF